MQVKSTTECSHGAFCSTFDMHKAIICLENLFFVVFLSGCLRQVILYSLCFLVLYFREDDMLDMAPFLKENSRLGMTYTLPSILSPLIDSLHAG